MIRFERSILLFGLVALLTSPLSAQEPPPPSVQRGFELQEADRPRDAIREFERVLAREPESLAAYEGLVWSYLDLGELEKALQAADRRQELAPKDDAWRRKRLDLLGQVPERRAEAVGEYKALVGRHPNDAELRHKLARLLSWSPGRLDEAIEEYRRALRLSPGDRELKRDLARTLLWAGRSKEARPILAKLHAERPSDPEVTRLLAQATRQTGDVETAERLVREGLEAHPAHPGLLVEKGWVRLHRGDMSAAEEAARRVLSVDENNEEALQILERVDEDKPFGFGPRATYSDESTPFRRFVLGFPFEGRLSAGTRIRFRPHYTWFRDSEDEIERASLEVQLRQELPGDFRADLLYGYHKPEGVAATHELDAELSFEAAEWLSLRGGVRQRAIVDQPRGYEDVAYFRGVGSGGTTLAGIEERLQIREAYGGFTMSPAPYLYVYADGTAGCVDDDVDNRKRSVATGLGVNLFRVLDTWPAHDLTLKYDFFHLSYSDEDQPEYFSPDDFQVHTPGLDYRVRVAEGSLVGVEAGMPLRSGEPAGILLGAFFRARLSDSLAFEGRWRKLDDTEFEVESFTANLTIRF